MIDVKETLNKAGERMEMAAMYLAEELSHIRAGRANVAILDGVRVNSYGSMVPLNQVANITTPDARTIPNSLITRVDDVSSSNSYANLFLNAYFASASNRLALEKELEREFKYEIDDMNGDVDILSVSPTKMEWKYDDGDIVTFRKRITE